jgi:hypothetical protein
MRLSPTSGDFLSKAGCMFTRGDVFVNFQRGVERVAVCREDVKQNKKVDYSLFSW